MNSIFSSIYGPSTSTHCLITVRQALSIPSFTHGRKQQHVYLPPIHDRTLYLAKRWYRCAMQHNRGVQDYIDNHTQQTQKLRRHLNWSGINRQVGIKIKNYTTKITTYFRTKILVAGICEDSPPPASFYIGNPRIVIVKKLNTKKIWTNY